MRPWLPAPLLLLPLALAWLTARTVDLTPRVDERFFFTSDSPAYQEARALQRRFQSQQLLVVTAYADDIAAPAYLERVRALTQRLEELDHVVGVRSLANGPDDLADARESPLWRRLLLLPDVEASNVILVVDGADTHALVDGVTRVLGELETPGFRLELAGVPYVVDAIARNLKRDFRTFSLAAVGVFAALILVLFRSWAILLGSLAACATAALGTLLIQQALGGRIGLLTANLVTISFVLTQSHVAFLANNWRQLAREEPARAPLLRRALAHTLRASSWCMVAALLGFGSLLFVEAQPLRELGRGGMLATGCALLAAYLVFPPFLLWAQPRPAAERARWLPAALSPRAATALLLGALALGLGVARLDTDPSLLAYFAERSEVHASLRAVDPHGGSSPLSIAVRRADGARLDSEDSYRRMWALQRDLQADPAVGTVVSLPVLMAEADRSPLAFFLSWEWLLDLLSKPHFDRVAAGFVTPDRRQGLFMLRMHETGREERRSRIVRRIEAIVAAHGFEATLVGGIYALQGRLADLVTRSLVEGLAGLMVAVTGIGLVVTRSLRGALAMAACTATVPAVALGLFGIARVPLDIIATPGVNVAIGVAVDSMIHLGAAWRRARAARPDASAAHAALVEQAGGILAFSAVVIAGFAIFAGSSFPPTQRFGLSVVLGAIVACAMALSVFPALLARRPRA